MCTEGPDDKQYIVVRYTEDQAGQDIRDEDVIQAENSVWYTKAEIKTCGTRPLQEYPHTVTVSIVIGVDRWV